MNPKKYTSFNIIYQFYYLDFTKLYYIFRYFAHFLQNLKIEVKNFAMHDEIKSNDK